MATDERHYTLREAVMATGWSQSYLNRLVKEGRLPMVPKTFPKEPMKVTRAAIEALGATWNDAAIQDRRRTQASEIAELRKDLETARGELARQRTRADIAERRAERAESELEGMRWSMRVMQGQDPSSDVREIDEPHVATAPSGEALPILDRDEGKK